MPPPQPRVIEAQAAAMAHASASGVVGSAELASPGAGHHGHARDIAERIAGQSGQPRVRAANFCPQRLG